MMAYFGVAVDRTIDEWADWAQSQRRTTEDAIVMESVHDVTCIISRVYCIRNSSCVALGSLSRWLVRAPLGAHQQNPPQSHHHKSPHKVVCIGTGGHIQLEGTGQTTAYHPDNNVYRMAAESLSPIKAVFTPPGNS